MKSNACAALEALLRIGNVGMTNAGAVLLIIVSLAGHVTAAEEDDPAPATATGWPNTKPPITIRGSSAPRSGMDTTTRR